MSGLTLTEPQLLRLIEVGLSDQGKFLRELRTLGVPPLTVQTVARNCDLGYAGRKALGWD